MGLLKGVFDKTRNEQLMQNYSESDDFIEIFDDDDNSASIKKDEKTLVYLGIDFGTSFTKIAYTIGENDRDCIKINNTYFIPSEVFFDGKNLSMSKANENYVSVKYFKYDMIPDTKESLIKRRNNKCFQLLKESKINVNRFSKVCSVFFLKNIISECNKQLSAKYGCCKYSINLGVPFAPNRKDDKLFQQLLFSAYKSFEDNNFSERDSFSNLEKILTLHEHILGSQELSEISLLYTTPEIIAEADFLLQRQQYQGAYYLITDIGGGTTDFAMISNIGKTAYDFYRYSIEPIGIETRIDDTKYKEEFKKCFDVFVESCAKTINKKHIITATSLLFGGGVFDQAIVDLFRPNCLFQGKKKSIGIEFVLDDKPFPFDVANSIDNLDEKNKRRLIIAIQLSNPVQPLIGTLPLETGTIFSPYGTNEPIVSLVEDTYINDVTNQIYKYGYKIDEVAKALNLNFSHFIQALNGKDRLSQETILKLAKMLSLSINQVIRKNQKPFIWVIQKNGLLQKK